MTRRAAICGRLGQYERYAPVDVCGLAARHEGPHHGRHRGMVWEDPAKPGDKIRIIKSGDLIHNIPPREEEHR